jgi:hypothetical protein
VLLLGFAGLLLTMFLWFSKVVKEAHQATTPRWCSCTCAMA